MATTSGSNKIQCWYLISGGNTNYEKSYMKIETNYTIKVSGSNAIATLKSSMYILRDSYGPSLIGPGYSGGYGSGTYINVSGSSQGAINPTSGVTSVISVGTDYVKVGNTVTHTVTYPANQSKTVTITAKFAQNSSGGITNKLADLIIPTSSYTRGSAGILSGTASITLPTQQTAPTYSKCTAPTSISCNPTTAYPGDSVTISWSGATAGSNMRISGYTLYYGFYGTPKYAPTTTSGWQYSKNVNTSSTSSSTTISIPSSGEGWYLTVKIVTRSSYSTSYNSNISTNFGWSNIEKIPEVETPGAPSVSVSSYTVDKGGQVRFSISYNADHCYYGYSSSTSAGEITGSYLYLTFNDDDTIYFWCTNTDGSTTKKSSVISRSITVYDYPPYAPSEVVVLPNIIQGIQGNSNANLAKIDSIQAYFPSNNTGDRYPTRVYFDIMYSKSYSTVNNNGGTSYSLGYSIVPTVAPDYVVAPTSSSFFNSYKGYYYKVRARFYNNDGYSDYTYSDTVYQNPSSISEAIVTDIINTSDGIENPNLDPSYFGNGVYIKWTNPILSSGNPNISSTEVLYQQSTNGMSWGTSIKTGLYGSTTSGANNEKSVVSNFTPGYYYRFGIRVTGTDGNYIDTIDTSSQHTFLRGQGPELGNEVFSVTGPKEDNMVTIRPYTNTQNIIFSSIKAISDNTVVYYIDAFIEDRGLTIPILTAAEPDSSSSGDTVTFTIQATDINNLLKNQELKDNKEDSVWNSNFSNVRYRIYAMDGTGMTSTVNSSQNTQIKFIESPNFATGEYISLGVEYNAQVATNKIKMASTTTSGDFNIANERMFNPGESVFLKFNKATDYNEDIIGYRLFVKRLDTKPAIAFNANYSTGNFEMLKTYSLEELNIDNNEVNMLYPVNSYTMNKFLIFAIAAVDSKGNLSEYKYSETYLIGCRIQNATIDFDAKVDNTDNKLKFTYIISDLGGSRFVNNQIYTYSQYPNFERTISLNGETYSKKARISLEYCLDGNFNNTSSNNYGITSIDYDGNTDFESIGSNNGQPITIATDVLNENFLNKKLYSRLVLIMSTGLGTNELEDFNGLSVNITYSSVYTYYADAPTVSHRANHIGINTNNFSEDEDEIFIVSDFGMRDKIKFIGTNEAGEAMNIVINVKNGTLIGYDTNNNQTILIDLKNKTIDGATISGGSW